MNTVLDKKKIVSKVLNKELLIAVLRDKQFYIVPNDADKNSGKGKEFESFFIYTLNEKTAEKIKMQVSPWAEVLGKCGNKMKVLNLINYPNYVSDLKYIPMGRKEI